MSKLEPDLALLHASVSLCFADPSRNSGVTNDDHISFSTDVNNVGHINLKVFYPDLFERLRRKFHISIGEIVAELQSGPFICSDLAGEFDEENCFSNRERLVITPLADDKLATFRETFQQFAQHQLDHEDSLLPVVIAFFHVECRKLKSKSNYFIVSRSIFPRQNHDYMFFLDLKGCETRQGDGGFLKDGDVTWEHEMSFPPSERHNVIDCLQRDTELLRNLNLTNYSLIVVITQRHVQSNMQRPGQPYGPDNDNEEDDRKKTLPLRHDVADGAKPIRADLIPKPRFCDEHPDWEYYFGLSDVYTQFRTKAKLARAFKLAFGAHQEDISSIPPPDYADRFMDFMQSKIFPSYLDDGKKQRNKSKEEKYSNKSGAIILNMLWIVTPLSYLMNYSISFSLLIEAD